MLYVDGEMPREDLQERFARLAAASDRKQLKPLRLLSPDFRDRDLPSLATPEGQAIIEAKLALYPDVGLVIIDAVSTLCNDPHANESDAKSWDSMQSPGSSPFGGEASLLWFSITAARAETSEALRSARTS